MFDKLFALVGPTWSALALLALVLAYFALAASETVRVAHSGEQTPPAWWLRCKAWFERLRHPRQNKKPPVGPSLPSSPYN